jgi:hypothetical protein
MILSTEDDSGQLNLDMLAIIWLYRFAWTDRFALAADGGFAT